ncbi:MAG: mechanosensitive ion channel family protein [Haloferacaceae archaeon]
MTARGEAAALAAAATPALQALPTWLRGDVARAALAVLVFAAGIYVSKFVVRLLGRPIARRFRRESLAQTVLRSIRLAVILAAAVAAAGILGFRPTDVLLSVTVFSAVLGLVLAPIVGNVINGLFVLADQPYEIGDMIELQDGTRGFVDDITIRYTKVFTLDNTFIVIPNSGIRDQQIVNYSAEDERTRLSLPLLITYESDVAAARTLFERAARDCDGVIDGGPDIRIGTARYPAKPTAYIDEYADSGILITLRYWAIRPYKLLTVRSRVQTAIGDLLAESDADVEIAYPHRQLVFGDDAPDARESLEGRGAGPRGTEPAARPTREDGG